MNRHFRLQVRLSCDGKLTRNRANSNFNPQPAIVILAPICIFHYCIAENFRQKFNFVAFVKAIF